MMATAGRAGRWRCRRWPGWRGGARASWRCTWPGWSPRAGLAAAEGAHPLRLGPLDDEQSSRLLAARLGAERVATEPAAVTELIARCGGLPLALAVMAARAAADPELPLGVLAAQLVGATG